MTLKDALIKDRYTEAEAEKQIKRGAMLLTVDEYIDEFPDLYMESYSEHYLNGESYPDKEYLRKELKKAQSNPCWLEDQAIVIDDNGTRYLLVTVS